MPFHLPTRRTEQPDETPALPVRAAHLLRDIGALRPYDPLVRAIHLWHATPGVQLPVVEHGVLRGVVSEDEVGQRLADDPTASQRQVHEVMVSSAVATPSDEVAALWPLFAHEPRASLPVVGPTGHYLGSLLRVDVIAALSGHIPPPRMGGMATPLGVYLTTGAVSGGAGTLGLILTGMTLSLMMTVAQLVLLTIAIIGLRVTGHPLFRDVVGLLYDGQASGQLGLWHHFGLTNVVYLALTLTFLTLLRFAPRMAGYHAAEHQVVNALEAGEPLTIESVRRMPRVHPRCGTNLWGIVSLSYFGLTLVFLILVSPFGARNFDVVATLAMGIVFVILLAWRAIGAWLQLHFTTRPATDREIASGIVAARHILHRYAAARHPVPSMAQRLATSGLFQVAIGLMIMGALTQLVAPWLDVVIQSLVK